MYVSLSWIFGENSEKQYMNETLFSGHVWQIRDPKVALYPLQIPFMSLLKELI